MKQASKPNAEAKAVTRSELLTRGVEEIVLREHLESRLASGKKLRVKHGIDPTGPKIHLGRAISLWKLRAFQNLGHKIVLIIGDFTAEVGDPSDKLQKRPFLTAQEIKKNLRGYLAQIGKVIDVKKAEIRYNSEWLKKLTFRETAKLAETFSFQQMLARRNFKERWEQGQDISMREFLYPLMQGYDSVAIKADVEIGGADQLFNLHAGREIQKQYGQEEQDILTTQMLEGTDGRKMSTSWGNVINITDTAEDMYGKIMSMSDGLIEKYFTLCCPHLSLSEVGAIAASLHNGGLSPRDTKMRLAREIVCLYHGKDASQEAEENFIRVFQKKEAPQDMQVFKFENGIQIIDVLMGTGGVPSKTEGKRLLEQGGVEYAGKSITDPRQILDIPEEGAILRVGKRKFFRIIKPK